MARLTHRIAQDSWTRTKTFPWGLTEAGIGPLPRNNDDAGGNVALYRL